jgi:hypothetical protein
MVNILCNEFHNLIVDQKKAVMKYVSASVMVIAFVSILIGCKKEHAQTENILQGIWIKGTNFGDTLQFMRINDNNILRYNPSFNTGMPAFRDMEYKYKDGKLSIKLYSPTVQYFYPINSFSWKETGKEFEIQGIELFSILASIQVRYTYRKL